MPSGIVSNKFWEMTKSVNEIRPLISSGSLSNLFSETSKHSRFFRFPTSYIDEWHREKKTKKKTKNSYLNLPQYRGICYSDILQSNFKVVLRIFLQHLSKCESWSKFPDPLPMKTGSGMNHRHRAGRDAKPSNFRQARNHSLYRWRDRQQEITNDFKVTQVGRKKDAGIQFSKFGNQSCSNQLTLQGHPEIFLLRNHLLFISHDRQYLLQQCNCFPAKLEHTDPLTHLTLTEREAHCF